MTHLRNALMTMIGFAVIALSGCATSPRLAPAPEGLRPDGWVCQLSTGLNESPAVAYETVLRTLKRSGITATYGDTLARELTVLRPIGARSLAGSDTATPKAFLHLRVGAIPTMRDSADFALQAGIMDEPRGISTEQRNALYESTERLARTVLDSLRIPAC